jgi:tRNA(Ile2) C34 agmatinyltransferase TiaS
MADSVDVISAAAGLSRATMLEIWDEVKANNAVLNACPRHEFLSEDPGRIGAKWRCPNCGGRVNETQAHWYKLGRLHG